MDSASLQTCSPSQIAHMSYLGWTAGLKIKVGEVIAKRDTKPDSQPFHHPLFLDRLSCENGEGRPDIL